MSALRPSWLADMPRVVRYGAGAAPRELAGGAARRAVRGGAACGVDRRVARRRAVRGACGAALGARGPERGSRAAVRLYGRARGRGGPVSVHHAWSGGAHRQLVRLDRKSVV